MHIKICGVTNPDDVRLLAQSPADLAGIWYGVDGGYADLPLHRFNLLAHETHAIPGIDAVLVTFINDLRKLQTVVTQSGVGWIQLHGFQPPSLVAKLKATFGSKLQVIKALHLPVGRSIESPLIKAYERAGVDLFLFDAFTADGRLGSSGQLVDSTLVYRVANQLSVPFFIAGGISATTLDHYQAVLRHAHFAGIDVDTGARRPDGQLCSASIADLGRSCIEQSRTEGRHETAIC